MSSFIPGAYDGIRNADYHADPALGSTSLKTLAKPGGQAKFKAAQERPQEHKTAFDLGTAAHSLILEGDLTGLAIIDAENYLTKAAKEARNAAYAEDKTPLLPHEFAAVQAMQDAVMNHPLAAKAFTGHTPERSIFWEHETGRMLKCRPDALRPGLIVDLKTANTAEPNEWGRDAGKFRYHQQAAHYIDGIKAVTGETLPFAFVVVEKEYPHLVSWIEFDPNMLDEDGRDDIDRGRALNALALARLAESERTGLWPGYPTSSRISLPPWLARQEQSQLEDS
ncbi:PD-(D/E)XK nuclease-like domain-containing protein [Galactobacter caseinivorans]|nr:PD-(D/E)XK nuclease-like domain-containing protein [Galactobacter caseinivorans]